MPYWLPLLIVLTGVAGAILWRLKVQRLAITHIDLRVPGLAQELDGFTIAHISDLHLQMLRVRLADIESAVVAGEPDIVCMTGDLIARAADLDPALRWLARLGERYPVFVVRGNNEPELEELQEALRRTPAPGVRWLTNENAVLQHDGARLEIIGFDDPEKRRPDLLVATAGVESASFRLGLAHSPVAWPMLAAGYGFGKGIRAAPLHNKGRRVDLLLVGHTHGGQVRFRGRDALMVHSAAAKALASGLFRLDATGPIPGMLPVLDHWTILSASKNGEKLAATWSSPMMLVSRGLGNATIPLRINCPPEVAFVRLRRAKEVDKH